MAGCGGYLKSTAIKTPFTVVYSTGNEDDFSAKGLEDCNPFTTGWRSSRYCLYPQEIVLQLEQAVRVRLIQLLSHHVMIPTKIEFFVAKQYEPKDHSTFTRLGYVSFSDNEATGLKKRELKSVYVDFVGSYLKLVLHCNHINKFNLYNQVGLIAVNILADQPKVTFARKLQSSKSEETELISLSHPQELDTGLDTLDNALLVLLNEPTSVSHTDDISFSLSNDPVTADLIKTLDKKKQAAVLAEDYDEAKRIKYIIDELSKAGEVLCKYEKMKRNSITKEDYDTAKLIKMKLDKTRDSLYTRLGVSEFTGDIADHVPIDDKLTGGIHRKAPVDVEEDSSDSKDILCKVSSSDDPLPTPLSMEPSISRELSCTNLLSACHSYASRKSSFGKIYSHSNEEKPKLLMPNAFDEIRRTEHKSIDGTFHNIKENEGISDDATSYTLSDVGLYDNTVPACVPNDPVSSRHLGKKYSLGQTPVPSRRLSKKYSLGQNMVDVDVPISGSGHHGPISVHLNDTKNDRVPLVASGSNADSMEERSLPCSPNISKHHNLNIQVASEVFGSEKMFLLSSKHHTDKKSAIMSVLESLNSISLSKTNTSVPSVTKGHKTPRIVHAASQVIARGLQDKVFTVFSSAQQLLKYLVGEFPATNKLSNSDYAVIMENVVPVLLVISGDKNIRLSTAAIEIIIDLCRHEHIKKLHLIGPMLIEPFKKSSVSSNCIAGRLVLLQKFVADPGVPSSRLTVESVTKYAAQYVDHGVAQVREEAANLLVQLFKLDSTKVKSLLPIRDAIPTQNKKVWKNLLERFDSVEECQLDQAPDVKASANLTSRVKQFKIVESDDGVPLHSSRSYVKNKLDRTCVFCGLEKEEFLQDCNLEQHYSKGCPMLHSCTQCGQVTEISAFNAHCLKDCTSNSKFIKCTTCKKVVEKDNFKNHIERECSSPPPEGSDRCPLCQKYVPTAQNDWKMHLMGDKDHPATCVKRKLCKHS